MVLQQVGETILRSAAGRLVVHPALQTSLKPAFYGVMSFYVCRCDGGFSNGHRYEPLILLGLWLVCRCDICRD